METQLFQATALTFEELGFIVPASDLGDEQRCAECAAAVEVAFHGTAEGRLILAVAGDVLPEVVSNMLGEEDVASAHVQRDALGELANVICGNVLPGLAGDQAMYDLSPPRPLDAKKVKAAEKGALAEIHVGLSRGRADVILHVTGKGI